MFKQMLAHMNRYDRNQWLIWSLAPGAILVIAMLVMAVVLEPRSYRAVAVAAAVVAFAATVISAKELVEKTIERWFVDARRTYAQGEAIRAEERGRLVGECKILQVLAANPALHLPYVVESVSTRTLSWLPQEAKAAILRNLSRSVGSWTPEVEVALKTQRCSNCGTPLNGVDHATEDYC